MGTPRGRTTAWWSGRSTRQPFSCSALRGRSSSALRSWGWTILSGWPRCRRLCSSRTPPGCSSEWSWRTSTQTSSSCCSHRTCVGGRRTTPLTLDLNLPQPRSGQAPSWDRTRAASILACRSWQRAATFWASTSSPSRRRGLHQAPLQMPSHRCQRWSTTAMRPVCRPWPQQPRGVTPGRGPSALSRRARWNRPQTCLRRPFGT
mmetsp:Transcript_29586/g.53199  ORF Transcript_29586/g.53199 Transcript_29586/m.53199 type:complete len:204 (+) Transcript_29586:98-709(+)